MVQLEELNHGRNLGNYFYSGGTLKFLISLRALGFIGQGLKYHKEFPQSVLVILSENVGNPVKIFTRGIYLYLLFKQECCTERKGQIVVKFYVNPSVRPLLSLSRSILLSGHHCEASSVELGIGNQINTSAMRLYWG